MTGSGGGAPIPRAIYPRLTLYGPNRPMAHPKPHNELRQALGACRGYFFTVGLFSAAINVLYLASPLYMLQVYDRVVSSGSVPTLLMLTLALLIALGAMAALDGVRARILIRAGLRLDRLLSGRVMAALVKQANAVPGSAGSQALRDFDSFRQFITGGSIYTLCDAPWAPIYIAVITLLHPLLGVLALGCALVLLGLALINEQLVGAMRGLKFSSPFGAVEFRAIDHQSTLGAYVGKTALKDGKGIMVDIAYKKGSDFLPSDAEV